MDVMGQTHIDDDRRRQVKEIVCDILEVDPLEVTETSLFKEDHDADSLRTIEILSGLERALGITIDQSELSRMVNLEGAWNVVTGSEGWKAS